MILNLLCRFKWDVAFIIFFSLLIRTLCGLSDYSGFNDPPKFGDYEAQRHWMEITLNLPLNEWYKESDNNPFNYWPLDYPPLSGYQSLIHGFLVGWVEPSATSLRLSWGYESPLSKLMMRFTVTLSDCIVFVPSALAALAAVATAVANSGRIVDRHCFLLACAIVFLQPVAIITDHGHFQYNCISLGLTSGAIACIMRGRIYSGSILFCLALNHKQMSLFFAPAFFGHLLGVAFQNGSQSSRIGTVSSSTPQNPSTRLVQKVLDVVVTVLKLGIVVILTFAICWAPVVLPAIHDAGGLIPAIMRIFHRIFPLKRGLFEDYVANFWCVSSLFVKWKSLFDNASLFKTSMVLTILSFLPSVIHQILRPSPLGLLFALVNSSFSFFIFGFQVHEKSILLPLLPATLLSIQDPVAAVWLALAAMPSMYPLLVRDGVAVPYFALSMIFAAIILPDLPPLGRRLKGSKHEGDMKANEDLNVNYESRKVSDVVVGEEESSVGGLKYRRGLIRPDVKEGTKNEKGRNEREKNLIIGLDSLWRHYVEGEWKISGWIRSYVALISFFFALALHILKVSIPPPDYVPWLYDRLFVTFAFANFVPIMVYYQIQQWFC